MKKENWYETIIEITTYDNYKAIRGFLKDLPQVKDRLHKREIAVSDIEKIKFGTQLYHMEKKDVMKESYQIFLKDGKRKFLHFSYSNPNGIVNDKS